MFFERVLWAANGKEYAAQINAMLQSEFGLVAAKAKGRTKKAEPPRKVLVWKDDMGIGRWRAHFRYGFKQPIPGYRDEIRFTYFTESDEDIDVGALDVFEEDPMNKAYMRSLELIAPEDVIDSSHMARELSMPAFFSSIYAPSGNNSYWRKLTDPVKLEVYKRYGDALDPDCRIALEQLCGRRKL